MTNPIHFRKAGPKTKADDAGKLAGFGRLLVFLVSCVTALAAQAAYACVPQPFISIDPRSSGPAGSEVTVTGRLFDSGTRIEIRWNGLEGRTLATADTPEFSLPVRVPPSEPGLYTILAVSRSPAGVLGTVTVVSFQVTPDGEGSSLRSGSDPSPDAVRPRGAKVQGAKTAHLPTFAVGAGLLAFGALCGAMLVRRRVGRVDRWSEDANPGG